METRGTGSTTSATRSNARPPSGAPPAEPPPGYPDPPPASGGRPDPGRDRGRALGWGLALIAAGTLWLLTLTGVDVRWELVLPIALIGIGLLLLARPRDEGGGLIGLGILVLVLGLFQPGVPSASSFTAGDRTHTVTDVAELEDAYALGAGSLVLDLRDLDVSDGPVEVSGRVTFGELIVRVPEDVHVRGDARVAFGEVAHFDRADGGINPSVELDQPPTSPAGNGELELDLRVAFGQIEVQR
jgi:hypothetical protein